MQLFSSCYRVSARMANRVDQCRVKISILTNDSRTGSKNESRGQKRKLAIVDGITGQGNIANSERSLHPAGQEALQAPGKDRLPKKLSSAAIRYIDVKGYLPIFSFLLIA